ncbi:MAG: PHP domain-containing protein [Dehalococcoidia bacterium]|nr:PHP domain-containing protein [Dehalococcoidia bacterium]
MMKFDLHLHTTASDGLLTARQLVDWAAELGLSFIAITDHDSVDGIGPALEAARAHPKLRVIPGVEISTDIAHGEIHVLGYFIDYEDVYFTTALKGLRDSRRNRGQRMLAKLAAMGMPLDWQRVLEIAGPGSIGRPHIAQAMLERGYVTSIREAFVKYIGRDGPAYAEREKMTPEEAVQFVVKARGLPVLAHPGEIEEAMVTSLVSAGLVGLEAYYNGYTSEIRERLVALARKYGLVTTGGSDFHGLEDIGETQPGALEVPQECMEQLLARAGDRGRALTSP